MSITREDVVAVFARRAEAWRRRDAASLAADHTDDCVMHSPMAGEIVGRAAIEGVYGAWFAGFPDFLFKADEIIVDRDRVVEVGTILGTDTGGFMGLPPTAKAFRAPAVLVYTLRDGKIARFQSVYDFTGVLVQIGMLKAKPA